LLCANDATAGPRGGSVFEFSTGVILKLELDGWGFATTDKLRLIPSTSACSNNGYAPTASTAFEVCDIPGFIKLY